MILENTYLQQLKQADPELADCFGTLLTWKSRRKRVRVRRKTRYLAVLATLLGCQGGELFREILSEALDNGVTAIEAKEVVYQAVAYLGIGRVFPFIKITNEVMENLGIHLPSKTVHYYPGNSREAGEQMQVDIFGERFKRLSCRARAGKKHAISIVGWPVTALEITTPEPVWM